MKKLYTPLFVILILSVMMLCLSCDPNNTPKTFTVTYELGDGKLKDGETNPASYTSETETFTLKNPIHESRNFLGWKLKGADDSTAKTNVTIKKGSSGNLSFVAVWDPLFFEYDEKKNCYAVKCLDQTITSCVIPSEYNGIPVKIIRGFGFNDCTQLSSITIPESITTIGNWAFQSCSSLTSITLPNGVSEIFAEAFGSCSNLESIYLPRSLKTIGRNIFPYCPKLKNIYYEGSKAEWNQINKHEEWDLLIRKNNYEIHNNSTM